MTKPATSLYLRVDGSLLLVQSERTIEMQLTPRQLLDLATDALRMSLALDPALAYEIGEVLANTYVMPMEAQPCQMN